LLGYAASGRRDEALGIIEELKKPNSRTRWNSLELATVYAALGDKEQAFALLEEAYDERSASLPFIQCGPDFDPLRDDPRFQDLLRRMNFPD